MSVHPFDSHAPEPRSTTSVLSLPLAGECFTTDHLEIIRKIAEPIFSHYIGQVPGLESEAPMKHLLNSLVIKVLSAGPVTSSAAFLKASARNICKNERRKLLRRQRWIPAQLFAFDGDETPCDNVLNPAENEIERSLIRATTAHLVWGMPEIDPTAVAVLSHWRAHASSNGMALRPMCRVAGIDFQSVQRAYRQWHESFYVPSSAREALGWILREHPQLPLSQPHYYYAAGCTGIEQFNKLAMEIRALYRVAISAPSSLNSYAEHVSEKAHKYARRSRKDWRDTEEAYLKNLQLAHETANRLSELF